MLLIPKAQRKQLFRNHSRRYEQGHDPKPVVKLFTPWTNCTWLLTELDEDNPDIAFGLCDLGAGYPELGSVSLSEISSCRGPAGLKIERDRWFTPNKTLSEYTDMAVEQRAILC